MTVREQLSSHLKLIFALLTASMAFASLVLTSCSQGFVTPILSLPPTGSSTLTPVSLQFTKTNIAVIPTVEGTLPTKIYYVSPTGSDENPGNITQPWKTIQKAATTMIGGGTVFIRGGTYNERVSLNYRENKPGPYITFTNFPNETVILDGTGINIQYGEGLLTIKSTDYIRVSGLNIQKSNGAGIYVAYSSNIKIDNNRTYDTVKSGIGIWGSNNVVVDSNDIALACNSHPNYPASEENITISAGSFNVEIKNNLVHQAANIPDGYSGGEGINIKDGSHDVQVHHNVVHLDGRTDGKPSNRLAFGVDAWNSATITGNIDIYNNVAYNSYFGFIVSSEQGGTVENVTVYNNIAYNIVRAAFSIPWWSGTKDGIKKNILFVNNTAHKNGYGFWIQSPLNENVMVRNNIFSQNGTNISIPSPSIGQTTVDSNLFFGSGGTYGTNQVIGDPKFVNPSGGDFHLQSGSSAIDTGSSMNAPKSDFDDNPRPQGAGFDMGAYEYLLK